jgi:hypothetical protein
MIDAHRHRCFEDACRGMLQAIQRAADPTVPAFVAYLGRPERNAVWYVRYVVREARALGLIDRPTDLRNTGTEA